MVAKSPSQKPTPTSNKSGANAPKASPQRDALRGKDFDQQSRMLDPNAPANGGGAAPPQTFTWATSDKAGQGATKLATPYEGNTTQTISTKIESNRKIVGNLAAIPNYHVILEQLAHRHAYESPDLSAPDEYSGAANKTAAQATLLRRLGYRKGASVESAVTGFQVTCFLPFVDAAGKQIPPAELGLPDGTRLRPVLAFRGTDGSQLRDILDDANKDGIGMTQMSMHAEEVRQLMTQAASAGFGLPDLTGHSLGGALAQRAAARCEGLFNDIVTFQAPGIGAEASRVDPRKNRSTHYMADGDVVSRAGGQHTAGEVVKLGYRSGNTPGNHTAFPLASLNAHRQNDRQGAGPTAQNAFVPGVNPGSDLRPLTGLETRESTAAHDNSMKSRLTENERVARGIKGDTLANEVMAIVDRAVTQGVARPDVVGRVAEALHSNPDGGSGWNAIIERNAMMRFDRLSRGRR